MVKRRPHFLVRYLSATFIILFISFNLDVAHAANPEFIDDWLDACEWLRPSNEIVEVFYYDR